MQIASPQVMSGGRPKGKSLRTLEKEREVAEQRDPTLRTARLALRDVFFAPRTVPAQEPASVCAPPATVPATVPAEEPVCADEEPVEPLAHTLPLANTLPKMPTKLADRLTTELYEYQGRRVRWNSTKRTIVCTCENDSRCVGNVNLGKCKGHIIWDLWAKEPVAGKRKSQESDRLSGASASAATAPASSRSAASHLLPHESMGIEKVIPAHGKAGAIILMEDGRWGDEMFAVKSAYTMDCGLAFPLRPGATWRRQVAQPYAAAAGEESAVIIFSILCDRTSPESPKFRARLFSGGTFAHTFTATSPSKLELAWLKQKDVSFKYTHRNGHHFMGLNNKMLAQHFLDVTPGFTGGGGGAGGGIGAGVSIRGEGESGSGYGGGGGLASRKIQTEVGERQQRRRRHVLVDEVELAFEKAAAGDHVEGFRMLHESKLFKAKYEPVLFQEYASQDGVTQGLLAEYKKHVAAHDLKQAKYVLSLYSPFHTQAATMNLFGCVENAVKQANWSYRLRQLPTSIQIKTKHDCYSKATVDHLENWTLRPDNVMRAAFSEATSMRFLLHMNRNRLFLKYGFECLRANVKPIGRRSFYKHFSENIFKDMKQQTCCCTQCVEKGSVAFETLRAVVRKAFGSTPQGTEFLEALENLQHFYQRYFRGMLKQSSEDVHMCMSYALSSSTDAHFNCACPHVHKVGCEILQQDVALFHSLRKAVAESGQQEDSEQNVWMLDRAQDLFEQYKAHLLRKQWDRDSQARMFGRLLGPEDAACIIDYGMKIDPSGQEEAQSECFGKSGISQFGLTCLMLASGFSTEKLIEMLGVDRANNLKTGDFVVFTCVLYNADASQDWVHSFLSLRGCISLLLEKFPQIKTLRLRSDGAGNFKCASFMLSMIKLTQWTGVQILEFLVSEAGGGKDLTDSAFSLHKHHIREGVKKKHGSARNAAEVTAVVLQGLTEVGGHESCATRHMVFERAANITGGKKGSIPGIASMYHFTFIYEQDVFTGMRVFAHEGIGSGFFYSAAACQEMWMEDGGLSQDSHGEFKKATDACREVPNSVSAGGRTIRGDAGRSSDKMEANTAKKKKQEERLQLAAVEKTAMTEAQNDSLILFCPTCLRTFIRAKCLATHVLKCQENLVARADKKTNKPLRPASEIAQDRVHSAASLCIGKGNEFKGLDNRELFFPKPLHMYDAPDGFVLPKEGYARKGVAGAQARQGKFNFNQKAFLIEVFENAGSSHKIKDKDAHDLMRQRFSDKATDDPFSFSLVLSSSQIKSW